MLPRIVLMMVLGVLLLHPAPAVAGWQSQVTTETFLAATFGVVRGCDDIETTVRAFTVTTTPAKGTPESSASSVDLYIDWDNTCTQQKVLNTSAHLELPDAAAIVVAPDLTRATVTAQLRLFRAGDSASDPGSWHDATISLAFNAPAMVRTSKGRYSDPASHTRVRTLGYDTTGTATGSVMLDGAGVLFSGWRNLAPKSAPAELSRLMVVTYTKS